MRDTKNPLPDANNSFDALPYPARDPALEKNRLVQTWLDDLPMINHYCFAGKQSFREGFRVLVAGGSTGDATVYLAEQLRHHGAQIVHLEPNPASTAIARERARIRGLDNIEWIERSVLSLPTLSLEPFDYINCSGVLHHLQDPDAGMQALRAVLKPDGALGLMVYARAGRSGVHQLQDVLRMALAGETDLNRKIANTRQVLASLPMGNWFRRAEDLHQDHNDGDAGLANLLLQEHNHSFSVDALFDWLSDDRNGKGHGLHLEFTDVQRGRSPYLPHMVLGVKPPDMMTAWRALPRRQQYAMAELLGGTITMHVLYATAGPRCTAPYGDPEYIPFYFHEPLQGETLARIFGSNRGQPFQLQHQHSGVVVTVNPGRYAPQILRLIDGQRSFGAIFAQFRADWHGAAPAPDDATLFADFAESYDTLNAIDRLLLRHPSAGGDSGATPT
ncbi:MAG: class I SAM-dependent methyltransferase [Burkholderiaceae bacterium]